VYKKLEHRIERSYRLMSDLTYESIIRLLNRNPDAIILDLGCGGGTWHKKISERVQTDEIYGIDVLSEAVRDANRRGLHAILADLNAKIPTKCKSVDVVISNQVIEHLIDVDNFIAEIWACLKPGGYAIISTENLSSLDNLVALFLGQQAFSQHISRRYNVGNIFSPHFSWSHKENRNHHRTIFTYYGLQRLFVAYGFKIEDALGIGFSTLNFLSKLDPIHSRFITIKARKPSSSYELEGTARARCSTDLVCCTGTVPHSHSISRRIRYKIRDLGGG
jgi:SAM-dependent methyltransferase